MRSLAIAAILLVCFLAGGGLVAGDLNAAARELSLPQAPDMANPDAIYYVATSGSDLTGDGTIGNPFKTIQHAVDVAASGSVISISPGTYNEHVQVWSKSMTLLANNPAMTTKIQSDTSRAFTGVHCTSLYLYGLSFTGQVLLPTFNNGGGVRIEDGFAVLRRCTISDSHALHNGGGFYAIDARITIDSCLVYNNQAYYDAIFYSGAINGGGGIYYFGDSLTVTNSRISNNHCGLGDAYGGGIAVIGNHATIMYCEVDSNLAEAVKDGTTDGNEVRGGGIYIDGTNGYISGCNIYDNIASSTTQYTGARSFGGGVATIGSDHDFYFNVVSGNKALAILFDGNSEPYIEGDGGGAYLQGAFCANNTFDGNEASAQGVVINQYCNFLSVSVGGGAIFDNCSVDRNIITFNQVGSSIDFQASCAPGCGADCERQLVSGAGLSTSLGSNYCNIYYGNTGADEWSGGAPSGNYNVDPLYCDRPNRDYTVNAVSFALGGNNPCGLQIGAKGQGCDPFVSGDANGDSSVNVADAVYVINYVFKGGAAPEPYAAGDANCDSMVNIGDAVFVINFVFKGGPEPGC